MERMRVWKFENRILYEDYSKDDFISDIKNKEKAIRIWETNKEKLYKQTSDKRLYIDTIDNNNFIFSNGYTYEELLNILNKKFLGKIKEFTNYNLDTYSENKEVNITNSCIDKKFKNWGGSERKKTVLYKGDTWMLKYPDPIRGKNKELSYINNAVSEYIGCKIAKELGLNVQEVEIGLYNIKESGKTKVVCLCKKYTAKDDENIPIKSILLEKDDIIYPIYNLEDYDKLVLNDPQLQELNIKEFFWKQFLLDAFICNPDRHDENWELISQGGEKIRLAPIFDCGSSLFPIEDNYNLPYQQIQNKVLGSYSYFKEDNKKINYYAFLSNIDNINNKVGKELFIDFVNRIDINKLLKIVEDIPSKVGNYIDKNQLNFYKQCIIIAYNEIFRKTYNKLG